MNRVMPVIKAWPLFLLLLSPYVLGAGISHIGELSFEPRYFTDKTVNSNSENYKHNLSISINSELLYENKASKVFIHVFARIDDQDSGRTHFDLRESYYQYLSDNFDLTLGIGKDFWGVTESSHVVDVINQVDALEDIDGDDKLGQPMARLNLFNEWGDVSLFLLPYFREKQFPNNNKRLAYPLPVNKAANYEDSSENHLDHAIRYQNHFGNLDIGLSYFRGKNREPILINMKDQIQPKYFLVSRSGLEMQYTLNSWLLKVESLIQKRKSESFFSSTAGFEYTIYGLLGSHDWGILCEYQYADKTNQLPANLSDDDVFLGMRYSLNNSKDTMILLGTIFDRQDETLISNFEFETRLPNNLKLEFEGRFFSNVHGDNVIYPIRHDDFINFKLTTYF